MELFFIPLTVFNMVVSTLWYRRTPHGV